MRNIGVRYLVAKRLKNGQQLWYWQPSRKLRSFGFLPRRLAEKTGTREDAIAEATRLNQKLDAWRDGLISDGPSQNTMPWLIKAYRSESREYNKLREKTRYDYDRHLARIEQWSEHAGHPPLEAFDREAIDAWYRSLHDKTPTQANAVMRVLKLLFNLGISRDYVTDNPVKKIRLESTPPRREFWTDKEIQTICSVAEKIGRPSIALSVQLSLETAQRKGDILNLKWSNYYDSAVHITQSKTGTMLSVPLRTTMLKTLNDLYNKEYRQNTTKMDDRPIIKSEITGEMYTSSQFRNAFEEVREKAGLQHLQYLDLRRTAIIQLGIADCSNYEISSMSGHSITYTSRILETYLPKNRSVAENAQKKRDNLKRERNSKNKR